MKLSSSALKLRKTLQSKVSHMCSADESSHSSLFGELLSTQLTLWTFASASFLHCLWNSKKRFCIFNLFFLLPGVFVVTLSISYCLILFVTFSRLFAAFKWLQLFNPFTYIPTVGSLMGALRKVSSQQSVASTPPETTARAQDRQGRIRVREGAGGLPKRTPIVRRKNMLQASQVRTIYSFG